MKGAFKEPSEVNYNYATIRITQSRLNKGLLAIPVALSEMFPRQNQDVQVYLNTSPESQVKRYSSYDSTTHECRIGGLKEWFAENKVKSNDEIVVQFLDRERFIYRLIPEKMFISATREFQQAFDNARSLPDASRGVKSLADWTQSDENVVSLSEFNRLASMSQSKERQYIERRPARARENVPPNLRTLLEKIYLGHCQICDFWFLKQDNGPYFEVHHLDPAKGHHPKNVVVVCGNCHNQFEYADARKEYDNEHWLSRVAFNHNTYPVKQALSYMRPVSFVKELFI
jgi:hypothetical protein